MPSEPPLKRGLIQLTAPWVHLHTPHPFDTVLPLGELSAVGHVTEERVGVAQWWQIREGREGLVTDRLLGS